MKARDLRHLSNINECLYLLRLQLSNDYVLLRIYYNVRYSAVLCCHITIYEVTFKSVCKLVDNSFLSPFILFFH